MSKLAADFFDSINLNAAMGIHSSHDLWDWVSAGASDPVAGSAAGVPAGPAVVYRGQSDSRYALSSSLYRLCKQELGAAGVVTEQHLHVAEQAILTSMRIQGIGRRMTDGELLMVLQHHGIPTRLIDVSTAPQEALFFAVDRNDSAAGRLFIVELQGTPDSHLLKLGARSTSGPKSDDERKLPWADAVRGRKLQVLGRRRYRSSTTCRSTPECGLRQEPSSSVASTGATEVGTCGSGGKVGLYLLVSMPT